MAIIFRLLRYPRARALAAWMSELVPSSKPLLMRLACQEMIPSQCSSTDLTNASTARVENALRRSTSGGDTPRQLAVVGRRTPGSLHASAVHALWPDASTDESARPSSPCLLLLCRQVWLVLQPDIPGLLEQWVVSLLNPADVVDRLRQQLHDGEAIERHLRIREVVADAGDEGVGHVRAGPCDQLGVATLGYQSLRPGHLH